MTPLILIAVIVIGLVIVASRATNGSPRERRDDFADALADARRWNERLGAQVLQLSGTDAASTQAIADASERHNAAASQISQAQTVRQAELARESALEGLYYMDAARKIMGLPEGPELPPLEGQRKAGKVTEQRTIEHDGRTVTASPQAGPNTPNYYPGGMVAGRPVPAGWYSEPWWSGALATGMWTAASVVMFSSLFHGMSGVGYSAHAFEQGYGDGYAEGLADGQAGDAGGFDGTGDAGDAGSFGDFGGIEAGDMGGDFDFGGFDF